MRSSNEIDYNNLVVDNNNDDDNDRPNFDRKLDLVTESANPFLKKHMLTQITYENCLIIINYVLAMQAETTVSERYRINTISTFMTLAKFHKTKSFKQMTRQDILEFLDRLRKPESVDPLHQWVGTYNQNRIVLLRFFKWLCLVGMLTTFHQDIDQHLKLCLIFQV
jgi:hypothetical protein